MAGQAIDVSPWSYLLVDGARCWHAPSTCSFAEAAAHANAFLADNPTFYLDRANCELFACTLASKCTARAATSPVTSSSCDVQRCARELTYATSGALDATQLTNTLGRRAPGCGLSPAVQLARGAS